MSDETNIPEIDIAGETYKLACNVPDVFPTTLDPLVTAPGFRIWSKTEIEDTVRNKPIKRREQFAGKEWILNQGPIGSCCAAACVGTLRRAMALNGRNDIPQLSWEFLYAQINGGRDRGALLVDGMEALQKYGAPPLDTSKHPLYRHIYKKHYDAVDYEAAKAFLGQTCYRIDTELELATLVLSGQGGSVVAVHVDRNFNQLDHNGFAGASSGPGNHAVAIDDVDIIDGELAFDSPGSWNLSFGDAGRCRLSWKRHLQQPNGYHGFFAVLAASNPEGVPVA